MEHALAIAEQVYCYCTASSRKDVLSRGTRTYAAFVDGDLPNRGRVLSSCELRRAL